MLSINPIIPELTIPALNIATTICWESEEGFELVYRSLENYRVEKGKKDYLDPIISILSTSNNVVMIANVCAFLITFLESSSNDKMKK